MKTLILISSLFFHLQFAHGQSASRDEVLIRDYISYISRPGWHIDTVITKFVLFYAEESPNASRAKRKFYLSMAVKDLSDSLKQVNLQELQILPYDKAGEDLRILNLTADYRDRSYVVRNASGTFVRYFLFKDERIESFVLFNKKAYLLLN
jgi:hypothetical protein